MRKIITSIILLTSSTVSHVSASDSNFVPELTETEAIRLATLASIESEKQHQNYIRDDDDSDSNLMLAIALSIADIDIEHKSFSAQPSSAQEEKSNNVDYTYDEMQELVKVCQELNNAKLAAALDLANESTPGFKAQYKDLMENQITISGMLGRNYDAELENAEEFLSMFKKEVSKETILQHISIKASHLSMAKINKINSDLCLF